MYNANMLVIYCDPKKHGYETYNKILKSLAEARRNRPLKIEKRQEGEKREEEVLFVMSTTNVDPTVILQDSHPQAIFLRP